MAGWGSSAVVGRGSSDAAVSASEGLSLSTMYHTGVSCVVKLNFTLFGLASCGWRIVGHKTECFGQWMVLE